MPRPIVLAGQSNAFFIQPFLAQAAAPVPVSGFAQDGSWITQWAVDAPEGYWQRLAPSLHQPLKAFVWWQGESDWNAADVYLSRLIEFLQRVRREANDQNLLIVICRVVDDPAFPGIRADQEAYIKRDPRSVLVSSDGLPREHPDWASGSAHLSSDGYVVMSQRILAAIH